MFDNESSVHLLLKKKTKHQLIIKPRIHLFETNMNDKDNSKHNPWTQGQSPSFPDYSPI